MKSSDPATPKKFETCTMCIQYKALINRDFGPYGKYLFGHSRRMDFTAFGPYALNVRTNISSYGPRARLIRAYYAFVSWCS